MPDASPPAGRTSRSAPEPPRADVTGRPVFYFDLRSPYAWLVAERLSEIGGATPEWVPVDAARLGAAAIWDGDRARVERLAEEFALPPARWAVGYALDVAANDAAAPDNAAPTAMLVATFAKSIGRTVAFALAAFRQAYNAGRDPGELDTLLLASAACEVHPRAVIKALELRGHAEALDAATANATRAGVQTVPALVDESGVAGPEALLDRVAQGVVSAQ